MSTRIVALPIFLTSLVAFGCSSQPTAPSPLSAAEPGSIATSTTTTAVPGSTSSPLRFGDRTPGVVYVTSQDLYYDTFVVNESLPMKGKFQLITADGQTEFGPGQPGYLGGRWWADVNGNTVQDSEDRFFLCPLLPPGRETP